MSISIYYSAKKSSKLNENEQKQIEVIDQKYSVETQILEYIEKGIGFNWESFCIYDPQYPTEPDVIFEGATKLPNNSEDAIWIGLQHWCKALSEFRRIIPDADWHVHVDDHEIVWDVKSNRFDPSI